jgi:amino acid permease ykbA
MQPDSAFPDTQAWSAHFIPMTFFGFAAMVASGLTAMLMRLRKDPKGILSCLALSSAYFGVMVYLPPIKNPDLNPYAHLLNPYWLLAAWLISVGVCIWLSFKKVDGGNSS